MGEYVVIRESPVILMCPFFQIEDKLGVHLCFMHFFPQEMSFVSCIYLGLQYCLQIKGSGINKVAGESKVTVEIHFKLQVHCCTDTSVGAFNIVGTF